MARYIGPVCRLCRREGMKLFLKGERCHTEKCAVEKRNFVPGQHGKDRKAKIVGYGLQLREKQKARRYYQVLEGQFRSLFHKADAAKGITGNNLLVSLERRLDNVAYRAGFAGSRADARQLVRHGHFLVNGKRVNIPSFLISKGDVLEVHEKSRGVTRIAAALEGVKRREIPQWVELDAGAFKARVRDIPARDDITAPMQERLVVELYSK